MRDDAAFDERLREALHEEMAPVQRAELDRRVRTAIDGAERAPSGRLALRPLALVVVLAAVVASAGTVAAVQLLSRSTESPFGLADAAEFRAEVEAAASELPLPPGAAWPTSLTTAYPVGSYARGSGAAVAGYTAFCLWVDAWLDANAAGNAGALAAAGETLAQARSWEPYVGNFGDESYRDQVDTVIAAASAGDREPIASYGATNCAGREG